MKLDKHELKALSDIDKYGCHIIHVCEDEAGPAFTYSIGIEKSCKQPELIVTGLNRELALSIINNYNDRVHGGEHFDTDKNYPEFLEGFDVRFQRVSRAHYVEYFGWGRWLYGRDDFQVYQLIWPSVNGVWPWDEKASADYKWFMPLLSGTLAEN